MAFTITAASSGLSGNCYKTGKNILFTWVIDGAEGTEIDDFFTAYPYPAGIYKVEIRIYNANTLVDVVALTSLGDEVQTHVAIEALDYTWNPSVPALYTFEITLTPGREVAPDTYVYSDEDAIVQTYSMSVCPYNELAKIACYEYLLYRPTGLVVPDDGTVYNVTLVNLDETLEVDYEWDVVIYDSIRIKVPTDGVYVLIITNADDSLDQYKFVMYEFCQLEYCFKNLVLKLWCTDALTPCCDDCDENATTQAMAIRTYLNKIIALMGSLLSYVFHDRITYLGINCIDNCRSLDIGKINGLLTKINETTKECGAGCGNTDCYDNFVSDCGCTPNTTGITGEINIES